MRVTNEIKISKSEARILVECPPCKRTVRFASRIGSKSYFIEIPKHVFIFPIKATKGVFYVSGNYPLQFLFEEDGQFYLPGIGVGHEEFDGHICISFDHRTIKGDVKETIEKAIEQLWASHYDSGTEGPYLARQMESDKSKLSTYLLKIRVNSIFSDISLEKLREVIKKKENVYGDE